MTQERPCLQLPLDIEYDQRLYEEWLRQKEKEQQDQKESDDRSIIIIDL
tara:strand:+ start:79 stop:225 length:147 start_codon:yes stop_codon:yes gene_type:complete